MEAKNINDSCIFDLQWHVIAMHGNSSEEIASIDADKTAAFVKEICLLDCCMQRFRKTLSGETFCYIKIKLCALSINLLFL